MSKTVLVCVCGDLQYIIMTKHKIFNAFASLQECYNAKFSCNNFRVMSVLKKGVCLSSLFTVLHIPYPGRFEHI